MQSKPDRVQNQDDFRLILAKAFEPIEILLASCFQIFVGIKDIGLKGYNQFDDSRGIGLPCPIHSYCSIKRN